MRYQYLAAGGPLCPPVKDEPAVSTVSGWSCTDDTN